MINEKDLVPKDARVVFESKRRIFRVYEWTQEFYDGAKHPYQIVVFAPIAKLIVVKDEKILIQEEDQVYIGHFLNLPGGIVEDGETLEEGAKRELLEEAGLTATELIPWEFEKGEVKKTIHFKRNYFIARNPTEGDGVNLDNGEKIKQRWLTYDEFLMLSEDPLFRDKELAYELLRLRLYPEEQTKFKRLLFGK